VGPYGSACPKLALKPNGDVTLHDLGLGHAGNEHRLTAGYLMTHDPSLIGIGDEAVSLLDVVQENPDLVTVSQEIGVIFITPIELVAGHSSLKCSPHLPPPLERVWHLMIPTNAQRDNALPRNWLRESDKDVAEERARLWALDWLSLKLAH
jgi:hypothetical protein